MRMVSFLFDIFYETCFQTLPPPTSEGNFFMKVLQEFGNVSSPTILFVIEEFLKEQKFQSGEYGLFSAMGPGFSSDIVLFQTT